MAKINSGFKFAEKKKNTVPFVEVPKNVKDALCIDSASSNGIFKIEPLDTNCMYDLCYVFEDINYKNQDNQKKTSTLLELVKILKSFDYQIKFTIANEQRDIEKFVADIFLPIHGEEYPLVSKGLNQWINQKIDEGTRDIKRVMYLTVTCRTQSFEEAAAYFSTLDTTLQMIFSSLKSKLYRLNSLERFAILQKILRVGEVGILPKNIKNNNDSWKNQIMPAYIESGDDCLKINNRYVAVLFAQDFDSTLNEERVVHSLTETLFPTYITLDIEPIKREILRDKLLASHTNNEAAISNENDQNIKFNQYGKEPSYLLSKKKQELESLMHRVDDNDECGVFLGMLVVVPAESLEELVSHVGTLKQIANTNGYTLEPYYHRQLKALMTALPIGGRQVNCMRSLLSSSAVAFNPFYAKDLKDEGGYVLGLNKGTKNLLIGNKKRLKSPHTIIGGHPGSGKSMYLKLTDISQTLVFTDDDIICIDPNNELQDYNNEVNGQYFDCTPQCDIHLNSLEVPLLIWESDDIVRNRFVAKKCEFGGRFVASCMKNIVVTQIHLNFVEKAIREVYKKYFEIGKFKKQPTWIKVREQLIQYQTEVVLEEERKILLDIINSLEAYTLGVYDMFAKESNIDISNRFVVFGLKNIPINARKPIMLTLMHCIEEKVEYNREKLKATRFIVDEAQVLCEDDYSAAELLYAVATFRKYGGMITILFQNFTHAIENPNVRDMISNCPCKIFFDQGGVDANKLAEIQELSEKEFMALNEDKPGHGVLVWDKQVFLFDAVIDRDENELYNLINTNFHDKAEEAKEKQRIADGELIKERILSLLKIHKMSEETLVDMCLDHASESDVREKIEVLVAQGKIVRTVEGLILGSTNE